MSEKNLQEKIEKKKVQFLRDADPKKYEATMARRRRERTETRAKMKKLGHRPGARNRKCKRCSSLRDDILLMKCADILAEKAQKN